MNRREFLLTATAVGALSRVAAEDSVSLPGIGMILGTVEKALAKDVKGTLRELSDIGYRHVEFSDTYGVAPATFKEWLADNQLKPVAGGGPMVTFKKNLAPLIERAHFFNMEYVVCYWPWSDDGKNKTLDDFRKLGDTLTGIGKSLHAEGLKLAYHNHDIEFARINDEEPYETILSATDPAYVSMELDLYWIAKGGGEAKQYLKKHPGRFALCHAKDITREGGMCCPGEGVMDFKSIFKLAKKAGLQYITVERDDESSPMTCARDSYRAIRKSL